MTKTTHKYTRTSTLASCMLRLYESNEIKLRKTSASFLKSSLRERGGANQFTHPPLLSTFRCALTRPLSLYLNSPSHDSQDSFRMNMHGKFGEVGSGREKEERKDSGRKRKEGRREGEKRGRLGPPANTVAPRRNLNWLDKSSRNKAPLYQKHLPNVITTLNKERRSRGRWGTGARGLEEGYLLVVLVTTTTRSEGKVPSSRTKTVGKFARKSSRYFNFASLTLAALFPPFVFISTIRADLRQ